MRVGVVVEEGKIVVLEREDITFERVDSHRRERTRGARELEAALVDMIGIDMSVAEGVDKIATLEIADLSEHHSKQRIGSDVERHAEEDVGAALIELAAEAAVGDIELEDDVAGRQCHPVDVADIPSGDKEPSRVGVTFYLVDEVRYLVDGMSVGAVPAAPLLTIDRAEVAVSVGPFVPYRDVMVVKERHISIAAEEPEQFVDDRLEVKFLGSEEREAVVEMEAHLIAEDAEGAGTGAVVLRDAVVQDML